MKKLMIAAAMAAMMGVAMAQAPSRPMRGPYGMETGSDPVARMAMNPKMAEKLNLTEEQTAKIREITKSSQESTKALRDKMRAAMEKQAEILKAEKVDEAAAMAAIDELFEVRKEMAKAQTKRIIQVKAILTPEQLAKAKEEMGKRMSGRPSRRGQNGEKRSKKAEKSAGESAAKE